MKADGRENPRLFGVIGHPIGHSLSPMMQNAAFNALGLPHHYHAFDVLPEHLETAIQSMRVLGINGFNVTIPHKEKIMPFIDKVDEEAASIGAVNTIIRTNEGKLKGYNTDGAGYVQSLVDETGVQLVESHPLLIGAGGAAKSIAVYLLKSGCPHITIANRTLSKAKQLAEQLDRYIEKKDLLSHVHVLEWSDSLSVKDQPYTLFINTTPKGMWPHTDVLPVTLYNIESDIIVSDIVYNPLKTTFLEQAEAQGSIIHQGLGMFIYQGAFAFDYFVQKKAPIDVMRQVVLNHLQRDV